MHLALTLLIGFFVGIGAAFSGLGGGVIMVPVLLLMGHNAQKSVGTSFLAILIISISALFAHGRLDNIDWKIGLLLGGGGILGAQIGAHLVENISTANFRRIMAILLISIGVYFLTKG